MEAKDEGRSGWKDRLRTTYRLVIMDDETFEEVSSYRLSLLNVYIAACTLFLFTALIVASIFIFTPLKQMIPGYGEVESNREYIRLRNKVNNLQSELSAQKTYTESIRRILMGDLEYTTDHTQESEMHPDTMEPVQRIPEDEKLRREVNLDEKLDIAHANLKKAPDNGKQIPMDQMYFIPPVRGVVSAGFAPDKKHFGVDVLAPKNTPVKATLDGYVIASDWTLETGNTIAVQHGNELVSFYKHNSSLLKEEGDVVKAGEAIAIIGNTGTMSDGPHLHFELWKSGQPVNPEMYVNLD